MVMKTLAKTIEKIILPISIPYKEKKNEYQRREIVKNKKIYMYLSQLHMYTTIYPAPL